MTYCDLCLIEHEGDPCIPPQSPERPLFAIVSDTPMSLADASGSRLWRLLKNHGLQWEDAHVTSIVKNVESNPRQRQINEALPFIEAELEYLLDVGCKYVLAFGASVFRALGGEGAVRDSYGVAHTHRGLTIYSCMPPGMALRSAAMAEEVSRYIEGFSLLVQGKAPQLPEPEIVVVKTIEETKRMVAELAQAEAIAYDIETIGLDEQHEKADIMCVAYAASPEKAFVVLLGHPGRTGRRTAMEGELHKLHSLNKQWIAHNGRFDNRWLDHWALTAPALKRDTILMAHLLDENAPKAVESVAARYLGVPSWGNVMSKHFNAIEQAVLKGEDIPYPPENDLTTYAALDVVIEYQLAEAMWAKLEPSQRRLHHFMLRVGGVLSHSEAAGVYVDKKALEEAILISETTMEETTTRAGELINADPEEEIKLGSSQWLGDVLFNRLMLPVIDYTPGGAPSTNEASLKRLRQHAPEFVGMVFEFRKHQKWLGSYLRPWGEQLTSASRLRSSYNLTGTVTGRLSCTNMPTFGGRKGMSLHQVPRDGEIRTVIGAPEGRTLIVADYSQIELRVAAALANEERMVQAYHTGEDLHRLTASVVTGKSLDEITHEDRERAKAVNFGFLYGMGARTFVNYAFGDYDMVFTLDEATEIRNAFFRSYSGLSAWHREMEQFVRRHGYVISPLGRVRHLPDVNSADNYLSYEAVRQGINSPVQATASDFTLTAMILIHEAVSKRPRLQANIVGQVHDSILVECASEASDEVAIIVQQIMERHVPAWVSKYFSYTFPLPLGAEVAIGKKWGIYEKVLD